MKQMISPLAGPLVAAAALVAGIWRAGEAGESADLVREVLLLLAAAVMAWVGSVAREMWNRRQTRAVTDRTVAEVERTKAEARRTDAEAEKIEADAESTLVAMYRLALEDATRTNTATSERLDATNKRLDDVIAAREADRRAHERRGLEIEVLRQEINGLRTDLKNKGIEVDQLREMVEQKNREREAQSVEIVSQRELIRTQQEEIDGLHRTLEATRSELSAAQIGLRERDAQIQALIATIAALESKVEALTAEMHHPGGAPGPGSAEA